MRQVGSHLLLVLTTLTTPGIAQRQQLPEADAARLVEVFRLAERVRPAVWPGWERTPMVLLLVGDSTEYLIDHPRPTPDFTRIGRDPLLDREVLVRPRRFPSTLLATFPAVGGLSTIVVGSAERTGKSPAEWVLILLHEHFHQWQSTLPDYYARASGLGLARGDTTGQWMLNYPFPYDSAPVQRAVGALAGSVARALRASDRPGAVAAVVRERGALRGLLSPDDYRYLEFQLWQEGVPRWVELVAAEAAGRRGDGPYRELALRRRRELVRDLAELSLGRERRVAFYSLGAGIAALLERSGGNWKQRYGQQPFALAALVQMSP